MSFYKNIGLFSSPMPPTTSVKIHFKTFTQIPHRQRFIDIGYVIWKLRTADQLERMALGTPALATRNKQSIILQYDMIVD
jgi:hypothetical protein